MILIIIIIFLIILYYWNDSYYPKDNMIYEMATFDNKLYWVRDLPDKARSANMIAKCKHNIIKLIDHLNKNINSFPEFHDNIKNSIEKINNIEIMETSADKNNYETTSYTINKKTIVFCIRSKSFDRIHDENTLMYVLIHEMAHVLNPKIGHGEDFKKIFKFLLDESVKINIYTIVNYSKTPVNYCGMEIEEYLFN